MSLDATAAVGRPDVGWWGAATLAGDGNARGSGIGKIKATDSRGEA